VDKMQGNTEVKNQKIHGISISKEIFPRLVFEDILRFYWNILKITALTAMAV
jgi:hypothetical protein